MNSLATSWLITGGTGTAGQALVRRLLADSGVRRIVIYSRDELKQAQMCAAVADPRLRFFLGDVRSRTRLEQALRGVQVVVHAAALKRVEACERDPDEAVATNIQGTMNVAHAAIRAHVWRCLLLSTDKAPSAHTLYGMTKAVAERVWIQSNVYAAGQLTRFAATRYGNVLTSRGSVLETFRCQHAQGVPLTLTSETATRFWMTIDQAVDLILLALTRMRGGEIFVPQIGSASVLDLARAVVGPDVYAPGHVVTGLRPGEKLHECLISPEEARQTYVGEGYYVLEPETRSWEDHAVPEALPRVAPDFSYRSDTNPDQYAPAKLRGML